MTGTGETQSSLPKNMIILFLRILFWAKYESLLNSISLHGEFFILIIPNWKYAKLLNWLGMGHLHYTMIWDRANKNNIKV